MPHFSISFKGKVCRIYKLRLEVVILGLETLYSQPLLALEFCAENSAVILMGVTFYSLPFSSFQGFCLSGTFPEL